MKELSKKIETMREVKAIFKKLGIAAGISTGIVVLCIALIYLAITNPLVFIFLGLVVVIYFLVLD